MAKKVFKGKVEGKIVELRFATSGKLVQLNKKRGDSVKTSELIGSLDKKLLQAELDRQLSDYERKRAEFEIFNLQKGEPQDEITKHLKAIKQAELNISVKDVEIAKAKLDQVDLFSPIDGIIIDDNNLVPGIYLTPASGAIKVIENNTYFFEIEISQENYPNFVEVRKMGINFPGLNKEFEGKTRKVSPSPSRKLRIEVKFEDDSGLILGLEGEATVI